ncbi:MAG TPA: NYN domain-containing protein [Chlorobaculum sp.]|nr:NYN domain-containing protein [Chlorobaculum sp.]
MEHSKETIAMLIDADNSPSDKIDFILAEMAKYGVVNIRRAYGNWKSRSLKGWEDKLHDYAIRPIQQFDYTKGKNATDMAMTIDGMDLLYGSKLDAFCIVSSDSDFTPLVMRILSEGLNVYGFGQKSTPSPFVNACSTFLYLESIGVQVQERSRSEGGRRKTPQELKGDSKLLTLVRNAVDSAQEEDGWSNLAKIGKNISNQASFDPRNYGFKRLSDLIRSIDLFDTEFRNNNSELYIRDKRKRRPDSENHPASADATPSEAAAPRPPRSESSYSRPERSEPAFTKTTRPEPSHTRPERSEPAFTKPAPTRQEPKEYLVTRPVPSEPEPAKPEPREYLVTKPAPQEAASANPEAREYLVTKPVPSEPEPTKPESREYLVTKPTNSETEPADAVPTENLGSTPEPPKPVFTKPRRSEPAAPKPPRPESAVTKPASSEAAISEPASSEPEPVQEIPARPKRKRRPARRKAEPETPQASSDQGTSEPVAAPEE